MRYQWIQKSRWSSSSEHLPTWLSVVGFNSDTLQSQEVIIIIAEFFSSTYYMPNNVPFNTSTTL